MRELRYHAKKAGYTEREIRDIGKEGLTKIYNDNDGSIPPKELDELPPRFQPIITVVPPTCPRCEKSNWRVVRVTKTTNTPIVVHGIQWDGVRFKLVKCQECNQVFTIKEPLHV